MIFLSIDNYIADSDSLQNKITNDRLLEKLINKHLPNFINDLNNEKYKLEKLNEVKLLAYNNSDQKLLTSIKDKDI